MTTNYRAEEMYVCYKKSGRRSCGQPELYKHPATVCVEMWQQQVTRIILLLQL